MKSCFLFLFLIGIVSNTHAQDGWFELRPDSIYSYQAPSEKTIFVWSKKGIERTTDGGVTWELTLTEWPAGSHHESDYSETTTWYSQPFFGSAKHGIRSHSTKVLTKYFGEYSLSTDIEVTLDGGATWGQTLSRYSSYDPTGIAFFEPSIWVLYFKAGFYGPTVPAPKGGIAISTDGGLTWKDNENEALFIDRYFVAPRPDILVISEHRSSHISQDTGLTWQEVSYPSTLALSSDLLYGYIRDYSGDDDGACFSTDAGKTWTTRKDSVRALWTNKKGLVYGATNASQPTYFRSLDTGHTYEALPYFQFKENITVFDTNIMYAFQDSKLLKSVTGGQKLEVRRKYPKSDQLIFTIDHNIVRVSAKVTWFDILGRMCQVDSIEEGGGWLAYTVRDLPRGLYFIKSDTAVEQLFLH